MIQYYDGAMAELITKMPRGNDVWQSVPQLMAQNQLVRFLRLLEISTAKDQDNVIEHLKSYRDLPRIHVCNKTLWPLSAILKWIERETINGHLIV